MITTIGSHTFETIDIPHYEETWEQPAVKVVNRKIVLDRSRQGTTKYETRRWEIFRDGVYIGTKRTTGGGCIGSAEAVALAWPRVHDRV